MAVTLVPVMAALHIYRGVIRGMGRGVGPLGTSPPSNGDVGVVTTTTTNATKAMRGGFIAKSAVRACVQLRCSSSP